MSLRDVRYKDKQLARAVEWQGIMAKPSGGRRLESGAKLSATCRGPAQDKGDAVRSVALLMRKKRRIRGQDKRSSGGYCVGDAGIVELMRTLLAEGSLEISARPARCPFAILSFAVVRFLGGGAWKAGQNIVSGP